MKPIRQGDVLLIPANRLPTGCKEVAAENGRVVLAHGEATGHAHAIYLDDPKAIVAKAIKKAQQTARLWSAPDGSRYLEVTADVKLQHEEHVAVQLSPGIYALPTQVEYTPAALHRVID